MFLGSPLTTVTMDRSGIAGTFPELIRAAEGPVLDTSCAALLRLAQSVHQQGYKVALTGEGADEALAGYVWYKSQKIRDSITGRIGRGPSRLVRKLLMSSIAGRDVRLPPELAIGGVRPAQQDLYELISQAKPTLYSSDMWQRLGDHSPYADLDITNDNIKRWHPAQPVALCRLQGHAGGPVDDLQGRPHRHERVGRVALSVPRRRRDLVLRGHRSGIQAARDDREVDLAAGGRADLARRRSPTGPRRCFAHACPARSSVRTGPSWVDQLLSPESLRATGYFDPAAVARQRAWQTHIPRITPARGVFDVALTCVVSTQLWHHIYCGGGLCDLPTWQPSPRRHGTRPRNLTEA